MKKGTTKNKKEKEQQQRESKTTTKTTNKNKTNKKKRKEKRSIILNTFKTAKQFYLWSTHADVFNVRGQRLENQRD